MQDGPLVARPGYVSLIPGGRQEFPDDPVAERVREQDAERLHGKVVRRRLAGGAA